MVFNVRLTNLFFFLIDSTLFRYVTDMVCSNIRFVVRKGKKNRDVLTWYGIWVDFQGYRIQVMLHFVIYVRWALLCIVSKGRQEGDIGSDISFLCMIFQAKSGWIFKCNSNALQKDFHSLLRWSSDFWVYEWSQRALLQNRQIQTSAQQHRVVRVSHSFSTS